VACPKLRSSERCTVPIDAKKFDLAGVFINRCLSAMRLKGNTCYACLWMWIVSYPR